METNRRGFLALLGLAGAAVAIPKSVQTALADPPVPLVVEPTSPITIADVQDLVPKRKFVDIESGLHSFYQTPLYARRSGGVWERIATFDNVKIAHRYETVTFGGGRVGHFKFRPDDVTIYASQFNRDYVEDWMNAIHNSWSSPNSENLYRDLYVDLTCRDKILHRIHMYGCFPTSHDSQIPLYSDEIQSSVEFNAQYYTHETFGDDDGPCV